jgi:omega-6 fatty acid desaturase (delta-12 desaturase)
MTSPIQPVPVPADQPVPHRKIIRSWLVPFGKRTTVHALMLLLADYALLLISLATTVLVRSVIVKLAAALAAGFIIGRLFIIGHDACHHSLTPHRTLNKWLGRIAFLPSLTPYSLWEVGHNVVHHGYTNLKGFDFIWAPFTLQEFGALRPSRRLLERIYRSGWAPGLYYLIEVWWHRMFFPARAAMPTRRPVFFKDCALVSSYGLIWISVLVVAAHATGQSMILLTLFGFLVPFLFWCAMIGFVVYMHHTHPRIDWYAERSEWSHCAPFVSTTVHLTFPWRIGGMLHNIMEHTAHHVDMSIPLYRLPMAQQRLEELLPERIVIQQFSWRWYFDTARRCKLYDINTHRWTGFDGRPST